MPLSMNFPAGRASVFTLCAALLLCASLGACSTPSIELYSQSLQVGAAGTRYDDRRDALRAFVREVESADWAREARLDAPLRMIRPELPQMPLEAYQDQASGVVAVVFEITPVGNVEGVAVVSAPHVQLGEACRKAVSEWLFGPITRQGRPVRLKTRMEFQFASLE
jgi:TonB family protein